MEWRVPLSDLNYGTDEFVAVQEVLSSGWLTMGGVTERFERSFAACHGVRHAIAVSNATVALHLANLALSIGPGDEVVLPSLTFVATANAVMYARGRPIFADVTSAHDLGISADSIKAMITPRTRAITVMHYGGYMCDMPAILAVAREHGLAVIEDAAHAPGAELDGRRAGTWGDVGCFSFFSNKNLVTGEGGMIVTNRDDLAERIRLMRSHGMTSLTRERHEGQVYSYDVVTLGYNYRIDEIRSALGLVQLEKLDANNALRRSLSARYSVELGKMEGLSLPYGSHPGISAAHLFPILLDSSISRIGFMEVMHDQGIQCSIHYPPAHLFTYYRQGGQSPQLPTTEDVASREVTLPLYPTMKNEDIGNVVNAVKCALRSSFR